VSTRDREAGSRKFPSDGEENIRDHSKKANCFFSLVLYYSALLEPILNRKRTNRAPRPLPSVAGAKTKNFPYLSSFPRRGVWGEPTKNGKEIFGFASPVAQIHYMAVWNNTQWNIII